MNTTGLVGYIALLMILGASLGGKPGMNSGVNLRADVSNYSLASEYIGNGTVENNGSLVNEKTITPAVGGMSRAAGNSQYVRIYMNGGMYEGTLYPVGIHTAQ